MWAQNIYWLIGFLIFGSFVLVVVIALYIGIRAYIFSAGQRRSLEEYHRRTRRADGKMYPPFAVGKCESCRRICKKIYFLKSGELLCPECYEPFWRKAEGWSEPVASLSNRSVGDGASQSRERSQSEKKDENHQAN